MFYITCYVLYSMYVKLTKALNIAGYIYPLKHKSNAIYYVLNIWGQGLAEWNLFRIIIAWISNHPKTFVTQ